MCSDTLKFKTKQVIRNSFHVTRKFQCVYILNFKRWNREVLFGPIVWLNERNRMIIFFVLYLCHMLFAW